MKKSAILKLTLAVPVLALLFSACSSKSDDQYFVGQISTSAAIQKEIKDPETGDVRTVFVPNIVAQAISDVPIIKPVITKNTSSFAVDHFTPYSGHVETDIESEIEYKTALSALNGTYHFTANNKRSQELDIWTTWDFDPSNNQRFQEGWNEFAENPDDRNITNFSYTNGTIHIDFKTLPHTETVVNYYMLIMEEERVSYDKTRLVREWKGARLGDMVWPITVSASEGSFSQPGFDEERFDGKKVFLAAVKDYGTANSPMAVMLLSNPKTIDIERGVFAEDPIPAPLCNCAPCICDPGECQCENCTCNSCPGL